VFIAFVRIAADWFNVHDARPFKERRF